MKAHAVAPSSRLKLSSFLADDVFRPAPSPINTAPASPAQGIGMHITRNGKIVPTNSNVSLATIAASPVNLGLTTT